MEAHKDISEMSFEEFFSEPRTRAEKVKGEKAVPPKNARQDDVQAVGKRAGFSAAGPKVNYTAGRFQLYVPRYSGFENDQFNVAIDCAQGVIPMGRIDAVRQKGGRTSRPTTLDLTSVGVSPLEGFKLTIDGEVVFENKPRQIMFFNNIGLPMGRPVGETYAVHGPDVNLRLVKAEVMDEAVRDGLNVTHVDVSVAGGIWVDDSVVTEEVRETVEEAIPVPKEEKPKKAPVKRVRVKASMSISPGVRDAEVMCDGETMQINDSGISVNLSVEGCDASECTLSVTGVNGSIHESPASTTMEIDTGDSFGPVTVSLSRNGKSLAECRCFLIPAFEYSFEGKGDITDDPTVTFTMYGESFSRNMYDEDSYGPFEHDGIVFFIRWYIPAVTYDIGEGPIRYSPVDLDILQIKGDRMRVVVKGARKKSLFFGGEKGKKRDVTPDWEEDYYDVDLEPIREEVYSHPSSVYCFYITVNSFPNRKFMTIRNPVRVRASFSNGNVVAEIDPSIPDCVCRLYGFDDAVSDVVLGPGVNEVPVGPDIIEAEVLEMDGGKVRMAVPVSVRPIPFLKKDSRDDIWLYVSRSKRIPLPGGLIRDGRPDLAAVKAWHERIVRMNPELRSVSYQMMQKAFQDYGE